MKRKSLTLSGFYVGKSMTIADIAVWRLLGWFKKGSSLPNPFLLFVYFLTFMSRGYYRLENPHWVMSGKEKERRLLTSLEIPSMQKFL